MTKSTELTKPSKESRPADKDVEIKGRTAASAKTAIETTIIGTKITTKPKAKAATKIEIATQIGNVIEIKTDGATTAVATTKTRETNLLSQTSSGPKNKLGLSLNLQLTSTVTTLFCL